MAQEEKTRKWDISISLGQAAPIGSYSKVVPDEVTYSKYPALHFYKEGHAAAKTGGYRSIEVSYLLNKHWVASIIANRSKNSVDSNPIADYLNSKLDPYYSVTSDNYVVNLLAVGMGYQFQMKKLGIRIIPIFGDASISSPEYSITWVDRLRNDKKEYYFDVPVKQNAILLGFNSSINYQLGSRLYLGLKTGYHSANFSYAVRKNAPELKALLINDVINYRLIETGIVLGIKF
jgi:hypothetical protein